MPLHTLKLNHFRSYQNREFEFQDGVNLITGPNGSGKTNILEAIYLLGTTRSFRGLPQQIVHRESDWFRVYSELKSGDEAAISWKNKQKHIWYNQQEIKPQNFIGNIPLVLFEPGSLQLVYGSPAQRRRLLDRILSFTDRNYLLALMQLRRILKQRNSLLRHSRLKKDQVFGWDVLLAEQAGYIRSRREEVVDYLNARVSDIYKDITKSGEEITLAYRSKTASQSYTDTLLRQLEETVETDHRYGNTSVGPHRDDVSISYNGQPLVEMGSRGEIRSSVIAMVLGELEYLRQHAGSSPVLLLDDVYSELDTTRQAALLENISGIQTIITATHTPPDLQTGYASIKL